MYFKQIEVAGFKSFADRLSIKFDGELLQLLVQMDVVKVMSQMLFAGF